MYFNTNYFHGGDLHDAFKTNLERTIQESSGIYTDDNTLFEKEYGYTTALATAKANLDAIKYNPAIDDPSSYANVALANIAKARSLVSYQPEEPLIALSLEYPFLAELFESRGEIAQAYICAAALAERNSEHRLILNELPLALDEGPFIACKEQQLLAFFTQSIDVLADNKMGNVWFNKTIGACLNDLYTGQNASQRRAIAQTLKELDPQLNLQDNLADCMAKWAAATKCTALERYQGQSIPDYNDLHSIVSWIETLYAKEREFRHLLSHCQDYRYGDYTIETAVDTLTGAMFHQSLHHFFPDSMEKLWVLHHLLTKSLETPHAYTRCNDWYGLNINGWGMELRRDGFRLSKTQILHYSTLKQLGVECIQSASKYGREDTYRQFLEEETTFFDFHLSHYQLAIDHTGQTKSRGKIKSLQDSSNAVLPVDRQSSLEQILSRKQPVSLATLRLFHRAGYRPNRQSISGDLQTVKIYYRNLENALRINLLAEQLIATGKLTPQPSRAYNAFKLIFGVVESAAYAMPLVGLIGHVAHHAMEIAHLTLLTGTHTIHTVYELYEAICGHHSHANQFLQQNPKYFIQALCLDLAIRFRHELKFLDNEEIDTCVKLHSRYILKQICKSGESHALPSPLQVYEHIIGKIDPSPLDYAKQAITCAQRQWYLKAFDADQESLRMQALCNRLLAEINPKSCVAADIAKIYSTARAVLLTSYSSPYEPMAYRTPHLSLDSPLMASLGTPLSTCDQPYPEALPVFSKAWAHSAGSDGEFTLLVDLMERISLLMLREMVLREQAMYPEIREQELKIIKSFTYSPTEQHLMQTIQVMDKQLKEQEQRIRALENMAYAARKTG